MTPYRPLTLTSCRSRRKSALGRWLVWGLVLGMTPAIGMAAYSPAALLSANNLSDLASAATAWTNLGGGTAGKKAASDSSKATVASVTGSFSAGNLAVFADTVGTIQDGGAAPTGTMGAQNATAVAITGGTINGTAIGGTTRAAVAGTTGNFNGILTTGSGWVRNVRVVTAAGTVTAATTDDLIVVNKTSGAATPVSLFASPTTGTGLCVKDGKRDAATNAITISPAAGTIDGAATFVMNQNGQAVCLQYSGSEWVIL